MSLSKSSSVAESWVYSARIRTLGSFTFGTLIALACSFAKVGGLSILVGWDSAILVYLIWVALSVFRLFDKDTATLASSEDPGRISTDILLITASLVSLVAVGGIIIKVGGYESSAKWALSALCILSVVLS